MITWLLAIIDQLVSHQQNPKLQRNGFLNSKSHLNSTPFSLHPMQFGFRKYHSTETPNYFLLENIKSKLDKGGVVGIVHLDLKRAFDTVNHAILIKLSNYNFSPEVRSYLADRNSVSEQAIILHKCLLILFVTNSVSSHQALLLCV